MARRVVGGGFRDGAVGGGAAGVRAPLASRVLCVCLVQVTSDAGFEALLRNIGTAPSDVERSELFRAAVVDHLSDLVLTAAQAQRLLDDPRVRDVGLSTIEVRDEEEE